MGEAEEGVVGERQCQPPQAQSSALGCPAWSSRQPLGISARSPAWHVEGHFPAPGSGMLLRVHLRFSMAGCDGFALPPPATPLSPPSPPACS